MNYKSLSDAQSKLHTASYHIVPHLSFAIPLPYIELEQNLTLNKKSADSKSISHS